MEHNINELNERRKERKIKKREKERRKKKIMITTAALELEGNVKN